MWYFPAPEKLLRRVFHVFMFYVGVLIVRLCFMSDSVLFIDWLYCIDLSSCIAASVFNKLAFFTYFTRRALRAGETEKQWRKLKAKTDMFRENGAGEEPEKSVPLDRRNCGKWKLM